MKETQTVTSDETPLHSEIPRTASEASIRAAAEDTDAPSSPTKKSCFSSGEGTESERGEGETTASEKEEVPTPTSDVEASLGSSVASISLGSSAASVASTHTTGDEGVERSLEKADGEGVVKKATKIHFGSIIKILLSHSRSRGIPSALP